MPTLVVLLLEIVEYILLVGAGVSFNDGGNSTLIAYVEHLLDFL